MRGAAGRLNGLPLQASRLVTRFIGEKKLEVQTSRTRQRQEVMTRQKAFPPRPELTTEGIRWFCQQARLAQSVEHETLNLRVVGSSPTLGEKIFLATNVAKGFMGSSGI